MEDYKSQQEREWELQQDAALDPEEDAVPGWFNAVHGAAMAAKASFPDQIDYWDPEQDDII